MLLYLISAVASTTLVFWKSRPGWGVLLGLFWLGFFGWGLFNLPACAPALASLTAFWEDHEVLFSGLFVVGLFVLVYGRKLPALLAILLGGTFLGDDDHQERPPEIF
jgi:hypothetical protein